MCSTMIERWTVVGALTINEWTWSFPPNVDCRIFPISSQKFAYIVVRPHSIPSSHRKLFGNTRSMTAAEDENW